MERAGVVPGGRLGPAQSKHGGLTPLPLLPSFLWPRRLKYPRDEIVAHGTMATSGPGTRPSPGCSERWPHFRRLLQPGAAASPPPHPAPGQPPPRPIPLRPWPWLLKVAGCLSAREKHRPSGEWVFLGGALSLRWRSKKRLGVHGAGPEDPQILPSSPQSFPKSRLVSAGTGRHSV